MTYYTELLEVAIESISKVGDVKIMINDVDSYLNEVDASKYDDPFSIAIDGVVVTEDDLPF